MAPSRSASLSTPRSAVVAQAGLASPREKPFPRSFDQRPTWSSSYTTSYVAVSAENMLPPPVSTFVMPCFLPAATHVLEFAEDDAIPSGFGSWSTMTTTDGAYSLLQGDRPPVKISFTVGKPIAAGRAICGKRGPVSSYRTVPRRLLGLFLSRLMDGYSRHCAWSLTRKGFGRSMTDCGHSTMRYRGTFRHWSMTRTSGGAWPN